MNALQTGIDAQSQIIPGEDPEALERLTAQYYDRFQPQGPEEVALIDSAISADWFLRRFRKVEAEMWNRSISREVENQRKWGNKPEKYPLAAAFLEQQKAFDRLQRRISAAERSLRASLETLARLRKVGFGVGQALPPAKAEEMSQTLSPASHATPQPSPGPPATPSDQTPIPEIGFVPEMLHELSADPPPGPLSVAPTPPNPTIRDTL
jgi:hypothetical protein